TAELDAASDARPSCVFVRLLDPGFIDVDANPAQSAKLVHRGNDNPPVAGPEVVHDVVPADVGHLQHRRHHLAGRRDVDDVERPGGLRRERRRGRTAERENTRGEVHNAAADWPRPTYLTDLTHLTHLTYF